MYTVLPKKVCFKKSTQKAQLEKPATFIKIILIPFQDCKPTYTLRGQGPQKKMSLAFNAASLIKTFLSKSAKKLRNSPVGALQSKVYNGAFACIKKLGTPPGFYSRPLRTIVSIISLCKGLNKLSGQVSPWLFLNNLHVLIIHHKQNKHSVKGVNITQNFKLSLKYSKYLINI